MRFHERVQEPEYLTTLRELEPVLVDRLLAGDEGVSHNPIMGAESHRLIGVEYGANFYIPPLTPTCYIFPGSRKATLREMADQPLEFSIEVGHSITPEWAIRWAADDRPVHIDSLYGNPFNPEAIGISSEAFKHGPTYKDGVDLIVKQRQDGTPEWSELPSLAFRPSIASRFLGKLGIGRH